MVRRLAIASILAAVLLAAGVGVAGAQENILWTFQINGVDGQHPASNLIFDAKGNLYGTTDTGGKNGLGTVYELLPQANGTWQEKILYTFGDAGSNDGANPQAAPIFDSHGNLFGTTLQGGVNGYGTVFELSPLPDGSWQYEEIYQFGTAQDGLDGNFPKGTPAIDGSGNLYGASEQAGGANDSGAVWELSPPVSGTTWTFTPVYQFLGSVNWDGQGPSGGLIFDSEGNLYGQTAGGGTKPASGSACLCGTVYELSPPATAGGAWAETILYSFQGSPNDAQSPIGGLIWDSAGNLYGASINGGADSIGAVYELSPGASGWADTLLHGFSNANNNMDDGKYPTGGPAFDPLGNLYLTTSYGGAIYGGSGGGTLIQLRPQTGGQWKESVLYNFPANNNDGYYPDAGLLADAEGNLYGTDFNGGEGGAGIVFEIASPDLLAAPVITPGTGTYSSPQKVKITDTAAGVTIYYTTNGENPTTSSEIYTEPIAVPGPEIIRAFADATGYIQSKVSSAAYAFKAAKPNFKVKQGTYKSAQSVEITDTTPGATIYYNINSKTPPTTSAKIYKRAITISVNETIQAVAVLKNYANSPLAKAVYLIEAQPPTITPDGGSISKSQKVTLKAAAGATIYYTKNGETPTQIPKEKYTAPFTLTSKTTVRAFAVTEDNAPSPVVSATFTIK